MARRAPTTKLSLAKLREEGFHVEIVEHYNFWSKRKNDLFGIADLLCVNLLTGDVRLVQTTTAANISSRIHKITNHENLPIVRKAGFEIHIHGWRKDKGKWSCRVEDVS